MASHRANNSSNNRIAFILAIVITAAWSISFIVDIIVPEYDPPASVHALMMIVAGTVFGEGLLRTGRNAVRSSKDKENEENAS